MKVYCISTWSGFREYKHVERLRYIVALTHPILHHFSNIVRAPVLQDVRDLFADKG